MTTRVRFVTSPAQARALSALATSEGISASLEPLAQRVLEAAQRDPNQRYVASLRKRKHISAGRLPRVSWRVGASPAFGGKVEAKRGTLARALSAVGL